MARPSPYREGPTLNDIIADLTKPLDPRFYSGVGSYLHFTVIPIWDVFTPATGSKPATENIDVADFGLAWGFFVVPEPSSLLLLAAEFLGLVVYAAGRRSQRT